MEERKFVFAGRKVYLMRQEKMEKIRVASFFFMMMLIMVLAACSEVSVDEVEKTDFPTEQQVITATLAESDQAALPIEATQKPEATAQNSMSPTTETETGIEDGGDAMEDHEALNNARTALAEKLQVPVDTIEVKAVEAVDWPDSCLGVSTPDLMCAQVITPGYRILLYHAGKQYEVHTDESGKAVLFAENAGDTESQGMPEIPLIAWQREGGIAGFCDQMVIYASGQVEISSCKQISSDSDVSLLVTTEQMERLQSYARQYSDANIIRGEDPDIPDGLRISAQMLGSGDEMMSEQEEDAFLQYLSELFESLKPH